MTPLQTWTVELVGPKGYVHGWIKVGGEVEHKDSSRGRVTSYDPNTQTVHADWTSGPRKGTERTTKAYHVKAVDAVSRPAEGPRVPVQEPKSKVAGPTGPTIKNADLLKITIGKKVSARGLPEGVAVHEIAGSTNSHAVFHNNEHIGYLNKRSGYSTLGRSGAAYMSANRGYTTYDRTLRSLRDYGTMGEAATAVHQSALRANPPKA